MTFAFGAFTLGGALLFSAFKNQSLVSLILGKGGESIESQHQSSLIDTQGAEEANPKGSTAAGGGEFETFGGFKVPAGTPKRVAMKLAKGAAWIAKNSHRWAYCWGGGHNSTFSPVGDNCKGYDCSGSWSAILHEMGILKEPLVSGAMAADFVKGPGKYITVYANEGHVWGYFLGIVCGTGTEAEGAHRGGFAIGNGDVTDKSAYVECHPKGW